MCAHDGRGAAAMPAAIGRAPRLVTRWKSGPHHAAAVGCCCTPHGSAWIPGCTSTCAWQHGRVGVHHKRRAGTAGVAASERRRPRLAAAPAAQHDPLINTSGSTCASGAHLSLGARGVRHRASRSSGRLRMLGVAAGMLAVGWVCCAVMTAAHEASRRPHARRRAAAGHGSPPCTKLLSARSYCSLPFVIQLARSVR